jgi:hypothetical protein
VACEREVGPVNLAMILLLKRHLRSSFGCIVTDGKYRHHHRTLSRIAEAEDDDSDDGDQQRANGVARGQASLVGQIR